MTHVARKLAISAAEAFAGAVLISFNLRWIAQARRHWRKRRSAAL